MTSNSFVPVVEQQHNTRGSNTTQGVSEQGNRDFDRLTIILRTVCAWLLIVEIMLLIVRQLEVSWGVLSGFWLLIGPLPTTLLTLAVVFGGAAYATQATNAGLWVHRALWWLRFGWRPAPTVRAATARPAYAQDAAQWKVRTTPRPQRTRGAASRRVMDMEV